MRRLMEAEMREMEEKLKTAAKIMVLKERESWKCDRQQLLDEKIALQRQLSVTETANRTLESDLNGAEETIGRLEQEISSLNHQFSALKEAHDNSRIILWRGLKKERQKAEEEMKKKDELIISLQQSLNAQKEGTERMGASADQSSWQERVSKLEALVMEKDKEISRVTEKRRARTNAHINTLALLNETQSALTQSKHNCDALEEKLSEQKWRKQLSEKESFKKELSEAAAVSRKELCALSGSWETRAQQWEKEKRELEESLLAKEKTWIQEDAEKKEEIQRLTQENLQLQVR